MKCFEGSHVVDLQSNISQVHTPTLKTNTCHSLSKTKRFFQHFFYKSFLCLSRILFITVVLEYVIARVDYITQKSGANQLKILKKALLKTYVLSAIVLYRNKLLIRHKFSQILI